MYINGRNVVTTHLIEEYKARANTILCCCGWFGSGEDFADHQRTSNPTDKKPSPNPYEMDIFMRPLIMIQNPDYFDYVHEN